MFYSSVQRGLTYCNTDVSVLLFLKEIALPMVFSNIRNGNFFKETNN